MDSFIVRKRRKVEDASVTPLVLREEESTDFKLAILTSLHPKAESSALLECLLVSDGDVEGASELYVQQQSGDSKLPRKRFKSSVLGYQGSLSDFSVTNDGQPLTRKLPLTKKGKTLHLFSPRDIEEHTPCSIIHNFLPQSEAEALLKELLAEAPSFERTRFKLFDRVVESPHTTW
jgi:hypothetical protein